MGCGSSWRAIWFCLSFVDLPAAHWCVPSQEQPLRGRQGGCPTDLLIPDLTAAAAESRHGKDQPLAKRRDVARTSVADSDLTAAVNRHARTSLSQNKGNGNDQRRAALTDFTSYPLTSLSNSTVGNTGGLKRLDATRTRNRNASELPSSIHGSLEDLEAPRYYQGT